MSNHEDVRKVADAKVCSILLEDYEIEEAEENGNWIITYTPKGRIRGGGFKVTISKSKMEVINVVRLQ